MIQIESLLSARLFMSPQRVGERIFFISNLSGRLSLHAMNYGGSVPEPRVVAQESRDLVADLSAKGKDIDILMFEDEGHDVLKYDNRASCYNAITEFFQHQLQDRSS